MKLRSELVPWQIQELESELEIFWRRHFASLRTSTREDLVQLQRALDEGAIAVDDLANRRGIGLAFGMVLAYEIGAQWARLTDATADADGDLILGLFDDETLYARPLTMITACLEEGTPLRLEELFESVVLRFANPPADIISPPRCTTEFDVDAPELEGRLAELATRLQKSADLSFLMIRGASFVVTVDAGRGNTHDLTMKVSFAGDRAMLAVAGGRADELERGGTVQEVHTRARLEIERAIEEYLEKHPADAPALAPLGE